MRKITILLMVCLSLTFISCTSPTQPPAERDLQVAAKQFSTITFDLAMKAKYAEFMRAYDIVKNSQDPVARTAALQQMSNSYVEIEYLLVQAERAQSLLRAGREWVRSQRGVLNVLIEKWQEAKKVAVPASQPSLTTTSLPSE